MQRIRRTPHIRLMLAMALVPIVCLVLSACAQTSADNDSASAGSSSKAFVASIFYYDYDDVYIGSVRNALTADLASRRITYQEYDADHDQITQNTQIDKAIGDGASVLIVNIVNSGSAERTDVMTQSARRPLPRTFPLYSSTAPLRRRAMRASFSTTTTTLPSWVPTRPRRDTCRER